MTWLYFQALRLGYCGRPVPRFVRRVFAGGSLHREYIIGRLYCWGCLGGFHSDRL